MEPGKWYWVEKQVIQRYASKVGYLSTCVYHLLASMADQTQSCFPSQQYIANKLGCSRVSVSRSIQKLKDVGLIRVSQGASMHTVYCLLKIRSNTDDPKVHHTGNTGTSLVDTNNTSLKKINNNSIVCVSSPIHSDYQTKLAFEIAEALGERDVRRLFPIVHQHEENFLRKILSQVRNTKIIKKSRMALFIYLIRFHERKK